MLEEINHKINYIKSEVAKKQVLEDKLNDLNKELYKSESELNDLENKLKKEYEDVEKLKKLSLSNILSTIMRNKEERMEKEEKEYLMAKIKYDNCNSKVKLIKSNINNLIIRINSLSDCENEYSKLLKMKLELFNIYGDEENKNKLMNMDKEIDTYLKEIKEIEESISAGNSLLKEIGDAVKLLESAKTWSTIDLLGGDLFSSLAKHQRVNDAQKHFSRISYLLENFNKELKDVNINSLRFSSANVTLDIFFDNIFTDISVNNQINKSYQNIRDLQREVNRILDNIKENKNQLNEIVTEKRKEYDDFINNI